MAEAERKIRFEDIFEEDVFARAKASAEGLLQSLKELDEALRKIAKEQGDILRALSAQKPSVKALKELDAAARQTQGTLKALDVVQKALLRVERQLAVLTSESANEIFAKRDQVKELTAELSALAASERAAAVAVAESTAVANQGAEAQARLKELLEEAGNSYFELSDKLNNLRAAYKNLAAAGKENTREAQALLLEITELDKRLKQIDESVGQFQRQVGSYTLSIKRFFEDVFNQAERAGGPVGQLIGFFRDLGKAIRGAGGGLRGLAVGVRLVSRALAASGFLALLTLLGGALEKLLGAIQELGDRLLGAVTGETAKLVRQAKDILYSTKARLELEEKIAAVARRRRLEGDDDLDLLREEVALRQQLLDFDLAKLERERADIQAELTEEQGKSLQNGEKIMELSEKLAGVDERIAGLKREQADLAVELLEAEREREARLQAAERERLERLRRIKEELLAKLRVEEDAAKTRLEALQRERDERLRLIEDVEAAARAEGVLDADIQRALAEARLAAERKYAQAAAELRIESLQKIGRVTLEVQNATLEAEIALIKQKYADLRRDLAADFAETGGDAEAVQAYEAALGAILEAENRELLQKQLEYIEQRRELYEKALEVELDLQAKNFTSLSDFERYKAEQLRAIRIQALERQLQELRDLYERTNSTEVAAVRDSVEAQLAVLRLQALSAMQVVDNTAEAIQKRMREVAQNAQAAVQLVSEMAKKQAEVLERRLQKQQEVTQNRINLLIAQAEAGAIDAEASIAALEKQKAEAEKQREAIIRQQQRREAAVSAFRSYASALASGQTPSQALLQVVRDFSVLSQLIRSLPTYFTGTEEVKPGGVMLPTMRDAILARLHVGERVVPAHVNEKLRGIPNEALPKLVQQAGVSFDADSLTETLSVIVRRGNKTIASKRPL